jgi:bla regulator protein blaR1
MINHLWQSTVFAVVAALLTIALRRNRAQTRYCLWLAASIKFLIPFSILVTAGSTVGQHAPSAVAHSGVTAAIQRAGVVPQSIMVLPSQPSRASVIPGLFVALWMIGFAIVVSSWWRRWRQARGALRTAAPLDLDLGVKVLSSPAVFEPGVFGIFHPVLLLPKGIINQLTSQQFEAILAHELSHIRRRDNLATAIHMVVEAVFWFHPLVWFIGARLIEERERACDEAVLRMGSDPEAYAEGILKICELYLESPLPCAAGVTGANLKKRIEEIMTQRIARKLNSPRKLLLVAAGIVAVVCPFLAGLSAASQPAFEVASIRLCGDGQGRGDMKMGPPGGSPIVSPGRLNTGCALLAANYPMAGLIQRAYGRLGLGHVPPLGSALPITGGPPWIYSDYYVINAQTAERAGTEAMEGPMLQALLEDRFKLKVHRETQQIPVYALTVSKGGPKLQPFAEGSCTPPDFSTWPMPALAPGKRYCKNTGVGGRRGPNTSLDQEGATLDYVCKLLSLVLDRPVIDRTGLTGKYNFHLLFAIDQTTPGVMDSGPPSDDPPAPTIFTVMQQLGLKLEAAKGPRDFLVIDRVERPSAN